FKSNPRNHSKRYKQKGLLTRSNPFFRENSSGFATRRSSAHPAANLIDLQRLPESSREALPALGTNLGQKSIFSSDFTSPKQFTQLPCRIARTLGERVRVGDPSKVRPRQGSGSGTLAIKDYTLT